MPLLYEHVNDEGEVTEQVQPVPDSFNHFQLQAKTDDPTTGWRRVADEPPTPPASPKAPKSAAADTTKGLS